MVEKETNKEIDLKNKNYFIKLFTNYLPENKLYDFKIKDFNWATIGKYSSWLSLLDHLKLDDNYIERLHDMVEELKSKLSLEKNHYHRKDQYLWFFKYQIVPMLVNKKSEGYKEIQEELFKKIFSSATKPKENNPNKLNIILLLALFSIGFYYFSACIFWEEAMDLAKKPTKKHLKSKRKEKKVKDEDEEKEKVENSRFDDEDFYESDWSDRLFDRIMMYTDRVRKPIKQALPDFHENRAFKNIFLSLISNFDGLNKEVSEWVKEEKVIIEYIVTDHCTKYTDMALFSLKEEEESNQEESELNEEDEGASEKTIKWAKETLSSEEVKIALEKLFALDLQKLVIECSLDFTTERTLEKEDFDDDEGSNGLSDEEAVDGMEGEEDEDCCGEGEDCSDNAS